MAEQGAQSRTTLTTACEECSATRLPDEWRKSSWVCANCGFPNPMPARARLELLADTGSLGHLIEGPIGGDPLRFADQKPYPERLSQVRAQTGMAESFVSAPATLGSVPAVIGALDFRFMGGTMSLAVGERIARLFERAADERRAVVICTASGGARMQEGTLALFQMTKTVAALARFRLTKRPYVAVLAHPTLGGVSASFANLADVIIAEPRARVGFAGPRVIEQLLGHPLPAGFQRAELVRDHGFIDRVVPRDRLHDEIATLVRLLSGPKN